MQHTAHNISGDVEGLLAHAVPDGGRRVHTVAAPNIGQLEHVCWVRKSYLLGL